MAWVVVHDEEDFSLLHEHFVEPVHILYKYRTCKSSPLNLSRYALLQQIRGVPGKTMYALGLPY